MPPPHSRPVFANNSLSTRYLVSISALLEAVLALVLLLMLIRLARHPHFAESLPAWALVRTSKPELRLLETQALMNQVQAVMAPQLREQAVMLHILTPLSHLTGDFHSSGITAG
ncbi:hypothetical protein [Paenibacillus sabinae]|uniref:Uncharacterized protein n=1 Tax=Paenibacillus sabinae T27 TaxID=1268072 RepID=X4ZHY8_9BACL|nr:hypothetical protein [Paenibacillus sabinae]AHV96315.1 hypothetical protein PSAB_06905 [Paenibacillus sabinae T27]